MADKTNPPEHPVDPLQPGTVPFSPPPRPKAPDAADHEENHRDRKPPLQR